MITFDEILLRLDQTGIGDILIALLILIVGWLIALVIAAIVRALLKRTRIDDRLALWVQGEDTTNVSDAPKVERLVSTIVFWLLMLMVIVAALNRLNLGGVADPFNVFLREIFAFLPRLISVG